MSNALVIINYNNMLCHNQRCAIDAACSRWQCNYVELNETVMPLPNYHTGAMKLLAFDLCPAERICVLDADTIIRSDTPSPFAQFPQEMFVAAPNKQPHMAPFYQYAADQIQPKELELIMAQYPRVEFNYAHYFNTGFVMASRHIHTHLFKLAFEIFSSVTGLGWWDQSPLNYAVQASKLPFLLAPVTWNYCTPESPYLMTQYIYHFAGIPQRYSILPEVRWQI